jgi:hypothetical protein
MESPERTDARERLYVAVTALIAQLRVEGRDRLATELETAWCGRSCLTDGWRLFVDAIDSRRTD